MNLKLVLTVSVLAAVPALALAQGKPPAGPKPTKADVQKVVQIIGGDKAKLQNYCDMSKINGQMAQLDEKKDQKKLQDLGAKSDALAEKLGPEYAKLMDGLNQLDENSPDAKDIAALFDGLDKQCK